MTDYIDRQAAIDALRYAQHRFTVADEAGGMGTVKWSEYVIHFAAAERVLSELPSAEVEPVKRGKWIYDNQFHWYRASCSECGYKRVTDIKAEKWNGWKYCPNCGAKMEAAPTIIEAEEGVEE